MKRSKKGFTIVELVIVIAVIAILAAVLIPTFSSLINKAKESSDTALVKNLNIIMAADEAENGKSETMSEALAAAESAGYTIEKITPTSSGDILWDEQNNRFVLKKADGTYYAENGNVTEGVNLWKITDDLEEVEENSNHYSYYLKGTEITEAVTAKAGVDVGENSADVNYANDGAGQTVTIRMNGGKLTVNAPNDTVNSYGEKESVDITAVASASYHENGKVVGNIEVKKGRVELGAGAEVNTVLVSSAATGDVKVDVLAGAKVGSVAPTTDEAKEDIAASTSIPADSRVEEIVGEEVKSFAGGIGTENSPYLIATAEQFDGINLLASEMAKGKSYFFLQIADITVTYNYTGSFAGCYDGNGYRIKADFAATEFDALFYTSGITGHVTFKNINLVMGSVGISLLQKVDWGTAYGAAFENITFDSTERLVSVNSTNFGFVFKEAIYTGTTDKDTPVYTFSNITNHVNLTNEGTCTGVLVGSGPCFNTKTILKYDNCVNNGTITGTSSVGFLYGNSAYIASVAATESEISISGCKNTGVLCSAKDDSVVAFAPRLDEINEKYQSQAGGSFISSNYLSGKDFTVHQDGVSFSIGTTDESVSYKLAFNLGAIYTTKDGKAWEDSDLALIDKQWDEAWFVSNGTKYFIDLPVDNAAEGALSASFKALDKKTAKAAGIEADNFTDGYAVVVKDNVTYLVFDVSESVYINCNVSLIVYAYDSEGNVLGIKNL